MPLFSATVVQLPSCFIVKTGDISCLLFYSFQDLFAGPEWFLQRSLIQHPA